MFFIDMFHSLDHQQDELEFKAPKGFVAPANSHQQPTRAFTATYSTEAKSSAPSSPTPIGGTLVRGRSGTTLTDNATADTAIKPPALVSSKSAVTVRPNAGAPGSPALDSDGQRRKLEQALAEILTLRNERDKSVAEHSNTQMLYMAEKEKTEKLLAALRKLGTQSPPAPGSAPSSQSAPAADVAALQAEVARLRSDLDTKTQVIAEQQQALDAYCVDESQHADAQQLRAELDAARSENVQLYAQLEAANGANAQLQASLDAALAAAGGGASDVESQERIVALEDRLTKLVSVVSVLMEQNRALKDRLGLQQTAPQQ